jgi:hypothetical protein
MQMNRQELLSSASRRVRRGRKTTGRIVVSALGFAAAYYFDTENGGVRRKRLRQMLQRTVHNMESALAADAGDPPPVFPPVLRSHGSAPHERGPAERVGMVR